MTNETGTIIHLGNTVVDIRLDKPVVSARGDKNDIVRAHVSNLDGPCTDGQAVTFELHIDSTGDRNARKVRPV